MKSRNNEGNEQKKKQHGKTNGKKMISVVLTLLLAVSTIAASFSGVNYIGAGKTTFRRTENWRRVWNFSGSRMAICRH